MQDVEIKIVYAIDSIIRKQHAPSWGLEGLRRGERGGQWVRAKVEIGGEAGRLQNVCLQVYDSKQNQKKASSKVSKSYTLAFNLMTV